MASPLDRARSGPPGVAWPPILDGAAATIAALARQFEASQWFEPAALRERQFEQLARTAPWLAAHSPAFAGRLREAGLDADALGSPEGLAALPPIDRRWFQREPDIACDAVPAGHEPLVTTSTSGSTGEYLKVRRTTINQLIWLALVMREHTWRGTDFSLPLATIRATTTRLARFPGWGPPANLLFDTGPAITLPISWPGDALLDELRAFGTGNLVTYPNALRVVLDAAEARGQGLDALQAVRTIGEVVTEELRSRTRAILGVEIGDSYSCQETGYVAMQCEAGGLYHVMAETAIVEVLRDDGTPCREGETGTVVVTDLHNHATPIVRYALGDMAEVGEPCPCGRGLPTLRRIAGRSRNLIRLPDGNRVWPTMGGLGPGGFLNVLPIRQYQYVQTEAELIEVRLVAARPLTPDEEALLIERLQSGVGYPFRVIIRYFDDRLPLPPSGKFEDFLCLI